VKRIYDIKENFIPFNINIWNKNIKIKILNGIYTRDLQSA